jgi:hypothetical protein
MFPRLVTAISAFVALGAFAPTLAPGAEAPYFEDFSTATPGNVPANFVETPDSAWTLYPGTPGIYQGAAQASGADVAVGSSINLTNVVGADFTVNTRFTLQTNGGFDFRLADLGLVVLAETPDVTVGGYRLRYYASGLGDLYHKLFLERAAGSALGAISSETLDTPAAGDQFTMTLHGAYVNGTLFLTGTLDNGSRTISVQMSDPAPLSGMNFGFRQRASASISQVSSVIGSYDDFSVSAEVKPVKLGNIAARLKIGTGNDVAIGGFIVTGNARKRVLLRGSGSFPEPSLSDPILELYGADGGLLAVNDNWRDTQGPEIEATGLAPLAPNSAALIADLSPSTYTAILRGKNQTTGSGLLEVYDLGASADSKLGNISARGPVGIGDNVMIAGVTVTGTSKARVIIRVLGPSLPAAGVQGSLADPTLELRDRNGTLVRSNDNWRETQETEIIATSLPPPHEAEPAIVADLAPTSYTAIVRGKNDTTGIAVVEVYHLN